MIDSIIMFFYEGLKKIIEYFLVIKTVFIQNIYSFVKINFKNYVKN